MVIGAEWGSIMGAEGGRRTSLPCSRWSLHVNPRPGQENAHVLGEISSRGHWGHLKTSRFHQQTWGLAGSSLYPTHTAQPSERSPQETAGESM